MKTIKYLFSFTLILSSLAACTSTNMVKQEAVKPQPVELMAMAEQARNANNLDKALLYYVQALEVSDKKADILFEIGALQSRLGNSELAINAYQGVVNKNPDHIPALTQLAIHHLEQRKLAKATRILEHAITLDQQRLQKHQGQITAYIALDDSSPVEAYSVLGVIKDLEGAHTLAKDLFQLALAAREDSPLILSNLGYSYYLSGNLHVAASYFKRAIDIDPQFERAWSNLGLIYIRNGQYHRALQTLKQVMSEADAQNDIGYFLMLEGRYKEAEYFLENAIDLSNIYFEKANANLENVRYHLHENTLPEDSYN